jgi:glutathione S-transferase
MPVATGDRVAEDRRMKLYYFPMTRAARARWMLEELGAAYELVRVDLSKGEQKSAEYRKIHPHGVVPALVDGDVTIFESSAICLYLADKFAEKGLAPPLGSAARGLYYQWMVYAIATAEPPVLKVFLNTVRRPEPERSPKEAEEGRAQFREVAEVVSAALGDRQFLVGDRFSAADVMIGSICGWSSRLGLIEGFGKLEAYVTRLTERPAYRRSLE